MVEDSVPTTPDSRGPAAGSPVLPDARPASQRELTAAIADAARLACVLTDLLSTLREPTKRLAGAGAAASLEVARRRSEEALMELEIALGDVRAAGGRTIQPNG
ncbi:hypothetical protein [Kutzneria sp. CA-103260]|uniref:hypothetical protein n=1 Tax=Kutzneria sp. CA-103260 TaxID=2802641 RepID=UPI001BA91BE0|nr:hypothetical protein [Kutzneria sp. CA-103260]QUQ65095.1 hypothetical protein JJ691_28160 [Kutzneria sp. CA-103260]